MRSLATLGGRVLSRVLICGAFSFVVGAFGGVAAAQTSSPSNEAGSVSVDRWIDALSQSHDAAVTAGRQLGDAGDRGMRRLMERWPELGETARRRAIGVASGLAKTSASARQLLVHAAKENGTSGTSARAYDALVRSGSAGVRDLASLIPLPSTGDRAAQWLAIREPALASEAILANLFDAEHARPTLYSALRRAGEENPTEVATAVSNWLAREPPPASEHVARVASALASVGSMRATVDALVRNAVPRADEFAARWWIAKTLGAQARAEGAEDSLGTSTDRIEWLRGLLTDDRWMLRAEAVESLHALQQMRFIRGALDDPSPRVRARAAAALRDDDASIVRRAHVARHDVWPFVRVASLRSLALTPRAYRVLVAAVDDQHSSVRASTIDLLGERPGAPNTSAADTAVLRRLELKNERSDVIAAAIGYVRARCMRGAAEPLRSVVRRGLSSRATDAQQHNATRALVALRTLDDPDSRSWLQGLQERSDAPPFVRLAFRGPSAVCGP